MVLVKKSKMIKFRWPGKILALLSLLEKKINKKKIMCMKIFIIGK